MLKGYGKKPLQPLMRDVSRDIFDPEIYIVGVRPAPPIPPEAGPLDKEVTNLNGYSVALTSLFGYGFLRGIARSTANAPTTLAATIDGSPATVLKLYDSQTIGGLVLFAVAFHGIGAGSHTFAFSGNVANAAIRLGDVLEYGSIIQSSGGAVAGNVWARAMAGALETSDITMWAGALGGGAYPITPGSQILAQWSSSILSDALSVFFGHRPGQLPIPLSYQVVPKVGGAGAIALLEVGGLKPIRPDIQSVVDVGFGGNHRTLSNGHIQATVGYDCSLRFNYFLPQLKAGQDYKFEGEIFSLNGDLSFDWCDGNEGLAGTTPAGSVPMGVGAFSIDVKSTTFNNPYRFADFGNENEDGDDATFEMSSPILRAV